MFRGCLAYSTLVRQATTRDSCNLLKYSNVFCHELLFSGQPGGEGNENVLYLTEACAIQAYQIFQLGLLYIKNLMTSSKLSWQTDLSYSNCINGTKLMFRRKNIDNAQLAHLHLLRLKSMILFIYIYGDRLHRETFLRNKCLQKLLKTEFDIRSLLHSTLAFSAISERHTTK